MGRRSRFRKSAPREVVIGELDREGRGVVPGDDERRELRVLAGLAGERVVSHPLLRRGPLDHGVAREVLDPSEDRVEPRCVHYGLCGGCSLMHMDPEAQLRHKQSVLAEDLSVGGVRPERWLEPLRGPLYGYRRRARLGLKRVDKKGKVLVGFRELDKRFVADLARCEVLAYPVQSMLAPIGDLVWELSISRAVPQVEVAVGDDVTALVFRVLEAPTHEDLRRFREFESEQDVRVFLQPGKLDSVAPLDRGSHELSYRVASDVDLRFRPTDFVQVNAGINRDMIRRAVELLEVAPEHRVLDLIMEGSAA